MKPIVRTVVLACAVAAPSLLWAGPGHAELIRRTFLVQSCGAKDVAKVSACEGYIAGIADVASQGSDTAKADVCIAKGVKLRPIRESVISYIESHPGADGPAAPAVLDALRALYKC